MMIKEGDREVRLEYTKVEGEIQLEKKEFIPLLDLGIQQTNKRHFGESLVVKNHISLWIM